MEFMVFSDELKVGNRVIDHEHRHLVMYINVLRQSIETGVTDNALDGVLQGLLDYTKVHFTVEEELMKAYDYPGFSSHIAAHREFKAYMQEVNEMFEQRNASVAQPLLEFLMTWFIKHIRGVDAKLADFIREKETG